MKGVTLRLTREQILEAVKQLSVDDKLVLRNQLEAELKDEVRRRERGFDSALLKIHVAYRDVAPEENEKDVSESREVQG